ncbi:hypothetical protein HPB51_008360 [Rhipicephalus microplus]|uniref:DDE Tnp4 domain-containing protein n=1 Tax=Rhipicephalus microplus TaxID=6941 RepID=A0A9J6E0C3_RHIMP|nr:hypothetical protein HPB51_008360 [Rhipicephalus microplus]
MEHVTFHAGCHRGVTTDAGRAWRQTKAGDTWCESGCDLPYGASQSDLPHATFLEHMGTYSMVLLAVVDYNYKFVMVDVGAYGKQCDGGVLEQSKFGKRLQQGKLQLPKDLHLPNTRLPAPCVFVGDEAFQLRTDVLRPYPGRGLNPSESVFNCHFSRARISATESSSIVFILLVVLQEGIE